MRAVLLTGGIYHDFDTMSAATAGILATADLEVEVVRQPVDLAAALQRSPASLVVVQALRWRILGNDKYDPFRAEWAYQTGDDLSAAINEHARNGGGVVSLHTGCICFDDWAGWHDVLGGGWLWGKSFHASGLELVHVKTTIEHQVTEAVRPFTVTDEHYRDLALDPAAIVLAEGVAAEGVSYPVAWARDGGAFPGRAVTLTIGHDLTSLTEPGQARLIRQAALWATEHCGDRAA